jgi:hypothetical protein
LIPGVVVLLLTDPKGLDVRPPGMEYFHRVLLQRV